MARNPWPALRNGYYGQILRGRFNGSSRILRLVQTDLLLNPSRIRTAQHSYRCQASTGQDLAIPGIKKTGAFVRHSEETDQTKTPEQQLFSARQYMLLTDTYIKKLEENDRKRARTTRHGPL